MRTTHTIKYAAVLLLTATMAVCVVTNAGANDGLSLQEAIGAAFRNNPGLTASSCEASANEFAVEQAGLLPNPSLELEFEEFGGSGDLSGTGSMSSRIGISQEFQLGGKRDKRTDVAISGALVARKRLESEKAELAANVTREFYRVAVLQELLVLERENLNIVHETVKAIDKRVELGESPGIDAVRASADLEVAKIALFRSERELDSARQSLAVLLGEASWSFGKVVADLSEAVSLPELSHLVDMLDKGPVANVMGAEINSALAELELVKARAWPDVELGGGVQLLNETNDHAFYVELSIPLPVFDRNQGAIKEAKERSRGLDYRKTAGLAKLRAELTDTYNMLMVAVGSEKTMREDVLPVARRAFEAVRKAYLVGEIGYLDMMESQKALIEVRRERLMLLAESHALLSELERLTGKPLHHDAIDNNGTVR